MITGEEIKKYRLKLGLTQEELAKKIGVSKNTILNYEKGGTIPESKIDILNNVLLNHNIVKEPTIEYITGFDLKIKQTEEEIELKKSMLEFIKESDPRYDHLKKMISLLEEKIELILVAKKNWKDIDN